MSNDQWFKAWDDWSGANREYEFEVSYPSGDKYRGTCDGLYIQDAVPHWMTEEAEFCVKHNRDDGSFYVVATGWRKLDGTYSVDCDPRFRKR